VAYDEVPDIYEIGHMLNLANKWLCLTSGLIHKINQITDYSWITPKMLNSCMSRLSKWIPEDCIYEVPFQRPFNDSIVVGYIDCMNGACVYEIKCISAIDSNAFLQLAIYSYLVNNKTLNYVLYNIYDSSCYKIYVSDENISVIIEELLRYKTSNNHGLSDEEFWNEVSI
jgi:hypothetical protein